MEIRSINQGLVNTPLKSAAKPAAKKETTEAQPRDTVAVGSEKEDKAPKKWTILHYTAADNNLTSYMTKDVNEMESVGSTKNMNLVVQLDRGGSDCKRYYLTKDGDMSKINSPMLKDMGRTDMADPKVLADFIKFGVKNYPAENYALIISDHGNGWKGAVSDDSHYSWMTTPEIRSALDMAQKETGKKMDILGFDACLMASTEVGYEMQGNAQYLVASENTEGANGWPYVPLLNKQTLQNLEKALRSKLDITPKDFAKKIVEDASDSYDISTLSATELSKMPNLARACNSLAKQIMKTDTPKEVLQKIAGKTKEFYGYKDLYDFADRIEDSKDIKDNALKAYAKLVKTTVERAVIAEEHSLFQRGAHGLTIEAPDSGKVDYGYKNLNFAKDTQWDEAMNHINS